MVNRFVTRFDTLMGRADTFMAGMRTFSTSGFADNRAFLTGFDTCFERFICFGAGGKACFVGAIGQMLFNLCEACGGTFNELVAGGDAVLVHRACGFVFVIAFFARIDQLFAEFYAFAAEFDVI